MMMLTGGLYESLLQLDVDGLFSDIVRQLLATVLRLEDEETSHDIGLKELKGNFYQQHLQLIIVVR